LDEHVGDVGEEVGEEVRGFADDDGAVEIGFANTADEAQFGGGAVPSVSRWQRRISSWSGLSRRGGEKRSRGLPSKARVVILTFVFSGSRDSVMSPCSMWRAR
jgi:hypothetical protein